MTPTSADVTERIRLALADLGLPFAEMAPGVFTFELPGERKLATPCRLTVGRHTVAVHAFFCRNPDENHLGVYRWLLERTMKLAAIGFAIDPAGDIYLTGKVPLAAIDGSYVDQLLGEVLSTADGAFNTILELGFATSIRKEWSWRRERGESTANLEAFRGWLERDAAE